MTDYRALAAALAEKAPAQARLLRYVLSHPNQTAPEIITALGLTDANFRVLVGKLRDRGVEIVPIRTLADPTDQMSGEYLWAVRSDPVIEHWAGERQVSMKTAWQRVQKTMISYLRSIPELDAEERGIIIGKLTTVADAVAQVDVYAQKRIEEAIAVARAKAEIEAEEAVDTTV